MKRRIYISGPMTGIEPREYRRRFREAEAILRRHGYGTINPCRVWPCRFPWLYRLMNALLGRDRTLTASRQAVGLILTKIVGGRPVTNITFTCKRMLRTYASRGDVWYYDKAPEVVKLMVNRIDMSALADLYKVTKDRRL